MERDEFMAWVVPELEKWITEQSLDGVSVDRIKDGDYRIDNLQLLHKRDNWLKAPVHKNVNAPDGTAWCHKCKKHISTESFSKNKRNWNGLHSECKVHIKECQPRAKDLASPENQRWCSSCQKYLPTDNFYKCKTNFGGFQNRCQIHQRKH